MRVDFVPFRMLRSHPTARCLPELLPPGVRDSQPLNSSRYPSQMAMPLAFGERLWIVRRRVLAFEAALFGAAAVGVRLG